MRLTSSNVKSTKVCTMARTQTQHTEMWNFICSLVKIQCNVFHKGHINICIKSQIEIYKNTAILLLNEARSLLKNIYAIDFIFIETINEMVKN